MTIEMIPRRLRALLPAVALLALHPAPAAAQALTAHMTSPVNEATNADLTLPIRWTTVLNAQAYRLYLGSTRGARDFADSLEMQSTSYPAAGVPASQTVFARLWTEIGGIWRFSDSSFTTVVPAPVVATLTSPTSGATDVDLTLPIQWTTVPNAQAYVLYVGSTLGASDLVNSFEIQRTSYLATGLPAGQTLFAQVWTKVAGVWRSTDIMFSSPVATITYPANGAANADLSHAIQ